MPSKFSLDISRAVVDKYTAHWNKLENMARKHFMREKLVNITLPKCASFTDSYSELHYCCSTGP
jgi:hypothetical protein